MTVDQNKNAPPISRANKRSFFTAFISTGIPFVVLFIITVSMARNSGALAWLAMLAVCVLALVASAVFALAEKRRVALGILAGTAIGVVGLVASCATVLAAAGAR